MSNDMFTKAGPVTTKDLKTGEVIRVDDAYNQKQLKAIINGGKPHPNSISQLIKDDPVLRDRYNKNMEQYYKDFEARRLQDTKGINATDLDVQVPDSILSESDILDIQGEGD